MAVVEIHGAEKMLRLLTRLPRDVVANKRGGVVAKSMRKGANLIRREMRVNLIRAIALRGDDSTGLLLKNLKVRRKKYAGKGEHFTVGVGNKKYPGKREKYKATNTKMSGQRLEYGTSKQAAAPWMRPAFAKTARPAIDLITSDLEKTLDKLAQKYLD